MIEVDIQLKRTSFSIEFNERFGNGITGIYGPSGSGKTSILNSICGFEQPEHGTIAINGTTVFSSEKGIFVPVEKRNIGYVFQEGRLFPHLTVEKNLRFGMKSGRPSLLSFSEVISMLKLEHLLKSKPHKISGGERQRVALGRSLLSSPDILLLDEPFSAVDALHREQILPFLFAIHAQVHIPILVVSHDITDLLKLTNTICLVRNGICIGHGNYHNLLQNERSQEILGANTLINTIDLVVSDVNLDSGLTILSSEKSNHTVKVLCEKGKRQYEVGESIKIFVRPDDIAISLTELSSITIQNQLSGTVSQIINRGGIRLCIVDVGFPLIVEITKQAQMQMQIAENCTVWCLFKSVAIDVAG